MGSAFGECGLHHGIEFGDFHHQRLFIRADGGGELNFIKAAALFLVFSQN